MRDEPDRPTLKGGTLRDEIDPVNDARRAEERAGGPARELMLVHRKPARPKLALQDLTNFLMIGCPHEPRDGELAEQLRVVSHCARAR